ncbi:PAS domain S-box protein [Massilia solisilvae]|uniref:histidine kinase n=1 Tax=Massilia solisilvae TaxID=1811225 RepID=A0ABT2BHM6_9BURK|nr:PAS domain S-box protein [Massilia solisilvae]MCS0608020.1 PAS domain S-box protein [Massilia solisilvae]
MLVDDQPANLTVLATVLADLGPQLVAVDSGEKALRALLEHEFALVLLDLRMPTMDGFETARLIREHPRTRSVPIIFMTAAEEPAFPVDEAYALGAVDYLTKPVNPAVLRAKVSVFVDLFRKNAELARLMTRQHQDALRKRDQRLRLILDNVRDYAFIGTDVERRVTEWEGGAAAITGWRAQEAIGRSADMLFDAQERQAGAPEDEARRALENGNAQDRRWHLRRDGSRFWADGVMVALRDERGGLRGFAKILRDATAERLAAERLAQSEKQLGESMERFALLLESAGEAIIGLGMDGTCTFMNAAGAAMLGYRPGELLDTNVHARIHHHREDGSPYPPQACPILDAVRNERVLRGEDVFWRTDGSMVPVAFSVHPMIVGGRATGAVLTFTDITGRRLAEAERERLNRELRTANDRMIDIFYRAPAFMAVMRGPEHVFEMVNERYLALIGAREVIGRPVRAALPEVEGQGLFEPLEQVYRTGEAYEGSNVRMLLQPAGAGDRLEEHFVDFIYMALREPDGSIAGVLVHGVDVSERTRVNLLAVGQRGALELAVTDAPLADVLDVLAHTAEDYAGGAALAAVQLAEPDGVHLRHAAAPSLPARLREAFDRLPVAPLSGSSGAAAWRAEPVVSADIDTDPLWESLREVAREHGLRAAHSVPILAPSGAVLGTFSWYFREHGERPAHETEAMALLANTASLVLGQRHEAQERQAAEERSRNILESMSEGFLALDREWRVTYANRAAEEVAQMSREEMAGAVFWELFPHVRGTVREQAYRRTAAERVRTRIEAYLDPHGRWFEINSFPTPDGGIALYFRDETERRRAEEDIRRLAALADQSSDFIGLFTPDAGGIYLNPAGRALAGLARDANIEAWRLLDFVAQDSRDFFRHEVLTALTGPAAQWEGELRFARAGGGGTFPVYFKGFVVRDAAGHHLGMATITRDITGQKAAEDELRRVAADLSEADHRKSEFLATLAHELRNPLAPIRTGLDLLRIGGGNAETAERVHDMMERQLGHLIHLVDDLLDIARITRGKIELKKEPVDLRAVVATALETSAAMIEGSGHTLSVQLPDEPLMLAADVTRLVQVLSNLLNNAAKYTPAGGHVGLKAWREDGQAVIEVSDSGVGIPPEALGAVFEMFTQVRGSVDRAQGGLGIGLSLVRRLVELHGGQVSAASAGRGKGSTFTVRLPLRQAQAGAAGAAASPAGHERDARPLRVLVVDDNADAAESLAELLGLLGHTVRVAHDGPQGYQLAREFLPDLVFLDIGLPGMSGHEVARAIRRTSGLEHVVLIALTGWGAARDMARSHEAGFDQHLTKPVSFEALEQAFAAAWEARR